MADATPARAFVKLDRYALFQQARLHRLSAVDAWMLLVLTLSVDYRTHECRCTARELAEDAQTTPTTAARSVERLAAVGLVSFVQPFRPHGSAIVSVLVYDLLVVPPRTTARSLDASIGPPNNNGAEPQVRGLHNREIAVIAAVEHRESAMIGELSEEDRRCFECGAEADGKPNYWGDPACREHEDF